MNQDFNQQPANQSTNSSQPVNPYTIDYLNQIAPKPVEPFWTKNKIFLAIGLVLALCLSAFLLLSQGNRADNARESLLRAYYNIEKTRDLTKKYQPKLRSSDLSSINTGLSAALSSEEIKLKDHLESNKIKLLSSADKKKNEKYQQIEEEYVELDKKLDDAFLNATLDEAYAREVVFHLGQLKSLLYKIKDRVNSKKTDEIIDSINQNLETSIKQIEHYNKNSD